jgi:parallel beta-helix repeat protein
MEIGRRMKIKAVSGITLMLFLTFTLSTVLVTPAAGTNPFADILKNDLLGIANSVDQIERVYIDYWVFWDVCKVKIDYVPNLSDYEKVDLQYYVQHRLKSRWYIEYVQPNYIYCFFWVDGEECPPWPGFVIGELLVRVKLTSSPPVHNVDTGLDYATIQQAINANETLDGHTILVDAGTYYENVTIDKSISLIGENKSTTIIDGNHTGNVIWVDAPITISGFTIQNAEGSCIYVNYDIDGNNFTDNTMKTSLTGVWIAGSGENILVGNVVDDCWLGIEIRGENNRITGNTVFYANQGIDLTFSSNTIIENNFVHHNNYGITLYLSENNTIRGNMVSNNTWGIHVHWYSDGNLIFHNNFINNTQQVDVFETSNNTWDNGYPSGGNYWSDYNGTDIYSGPYQNETGSDGIGDTAYVVYANNTDRYPLMYPWGTPPPPSYTLTIYSSPTGVTFTVDGVSRTTPWSGTYSENASISLEMPETHDGYVWNHWQEDGDTNRTKTVTMNKNITLTGVFTPVPPIATMDIDPDTLNLKSKGKWITCYIEIPKGYDVSDIDRTTILLNGTIPVASFWVDKPLESVVGDYDDDGIPDLMVKFSRTEVSEYIHYVKGITYGDVTLTITGELYDGSLFEGSDVIRIKMPSEVNSDDDEYVDICDIAIPEFPSLIVLPTFMIATLLAVISYRRKHSM